MFDDKLYMKIDLNTFKDVRLGKNQGMEQLELERLIYEKFMMTVPFQFRKMFFATPFYIQVDKIPYSDYRYCEECESARMTTWEARDLQPFDIIIHIKEMERDKPIIEMPKLEPHPIEIRYIERPTLWQKIKKLFKKENK